MRMAAAALLTICLFSGSAYAQSPTQIIGGNVCPAGQPEETCNCGNQLGLNTNGTPATPGQSQSECRFSHNDNSIHIGNPHPASPS